MFKFDIDTTQWYFPICFHCQTVGNNRRPYNFQIKFLCFNFIICIDEASRPDYWQQKTGLIGGKNE